MGVGESAVRRMAGLARRPPVYVVRIVGVTCAVCLILGGYEGLMALTATHLPRGAMSRVTCEWSGDQVVSSGVLRNMGSTDARFQVTPRFVIAGVGRIGTPVMASFVRVPAGSSRRWTWTYARHMHGMAGSPITGCTPSVQTIPPPSSND